MIKRAYYLWAIFFIGVVCCYDNMLSVIYRDTLVEMEKNPLGLWLIEYGVDFFVLVKAINTVLAVMVLYAVSFTKWRMLIFAVAFGQAYLFYYLNFYDLIDGQDTPSTTPVEHVIDHFIKGKPLPDFDAFLVDHWRS